MKMSKNKKEVIIDTTKAVKSIDELAKSTEKLTKLPIEPEVDISKAKKSIDDLAKATEKLTQVPLELEIDASGAAKSIDELAKSTEKLKLPPLEPEVDTTKATKSINELAKSERTLLDVQADLVKSQDALLSAMKSGDKERIKAARSAKSLLSAEKTLMTQQEKFNASLENGEKACLNMDNGLVGLIASAPKFIKANGGMVGAVKAMNAALKANPIGLVVTAVGLLVAAFSKATAMFRDTSEGSEKMASILGRLQPLLNKLKETFMVLGEAVFWAVDKMVDAYEAAIEMMGKFIPSMAKLSEEMKTSEKNTIRLTKANREYETSLKDVEKAEAAWNKGLSEIEFSEKPFKEKMDAVNKLYEANKAIIDKQVDTYRKAYEASMATMAEVGKKATEAQKKEHAEHQDRYTALVEKQTTMYRDYQSTIKGYNDEIAASNAEVAASIKEINDMLLTGNKAVFDFQEGMKVINSANYQTNKELVHSLQELFKSSTEPLDKAIDETQAKLSAAKFTVHINGEDATEADLALVTQWEERLNKLIADKDAVTSKYSNELYGAVSTKMEVEP